MLQIDGLHRIHMMNIDSSVNWVFAVPHVETVISNYDFIADRLPLTTSIELLVHPSIPAEGPFADSLLNTKISIPVEVVLQGEELVSRPQLHRDNPSLHQELLHRALQGVVRTREPRLEP